MKNFLSTYNIYRKGWKNGRLMSLKKAIWNHVFHKRQYLNPHLWGGSGKPFRITWV